MATMFVSSFAFKTKIAFCFEVAIVATLITGKFALVSNGIIRGLFRRRDRALPARHDRFFTVKAGTTYSFPAECRDGRLFFVAPRLFLSLGLNLRRAAPAGCATHTLRLQLCTLERMTSPDEERPREDVKTGIAVKATSLAL